jgi:hypothetical protein
MRSWIVRLSQNPSNVDEETGDKSSPQSARSADPKTCQRHQYPFGIHLSPPDVQHSIEDCESNPLRDVILATNAITSL